MRITVEEARNRVKQNKVQSSPQVNRVMAKTRGVQEEQEELTLLRSVKKDSLDRVYMFQDGNTVTITPADDALPVVLGEFDINGELTGLNPILVEWLSFIADGVKWAQENNYSTTQEDSNEEAASNEGGMDIDESPETEEQTRTYELIGPLLGDIHWQQDRPYNNKLKFTSVSVPKGKKLGEQYPCLVGCPATAAAQIIYYFSKQGYRPGCLRTSGFTSDTWNNYRFEVPVNNSCPQFDYDNMIDHYSYKDSSNKTQDEVYTDEQAEAAAKLCSYLAMAGYSMFSPIDTGMYMENLIVILQKGFGFSDAQIIKRGPKKGSLQFSDDTQCIKLIKEQLRQGYPVIVSGYQGVKIDNRGKYVYSGGHCFICDGYREEDNTFHFNWGYGPYRGDGWYRVDLQSVETDSGADWDYDVFQYFGHMITFGNPTALPNSWKRYDLNDDGFINPVDWTIAINLMNQINVSESSMYQNKRAGCSIRPVWKGNGVPSSHEYVDFHLPSGILWATQNIGATATQDYGDYIAWRRTEAISPYIYEDSLDGDFTVNNIAGTNQDAATVQWGSGWQLPSENDFNDLIEYCDFKLHAEKSIEEASAGNYVEKIYRFIEVTRKRRKYTPQEQAEYDQTGVAPEIPTNSILLPLAGLKYLTAESHIGVEGYYWTSINGNKYGNNYRAKCVKFTFSMPEGTEIADVNYDGVVDSADVQAIIDYVLGRNR